MLSRPTNAKIATILEARVSCGFADMCNSLSEFFSRQLANSKSQETIPMLVPVKLLVAAQIELIAHDKTPNLFVRLAVRNFKTDLQRINTKGRFWRQCKK